MQSAVDRSGEFADFKFTRSSACTYRWAKDMDPRLYRRITGLIKERRWEVIGGWIEQPDCNLPSAESFIRQSLLGKTFFSTEFGKAGETRIGYNVDSFGHSGGLPQILKHCGFDYYVFMRPLETENPRLPLLFWWAGPDGSRVLTQRIPVQYSQSYSADADAIERSVRLHFDKGFAPGFRHGVMWLGIGNHGGGPTREHLERIKKLQKDRSLPEIRFSTLQEYFSAIERDPGFPSLPVFAEELQYNNRGCYAATGEAKLLHRQAEKRLYIADALLTVTERSSHVLDPAKWKLGFNQFHDILAGTCVPSTQDETRHRFGASITEADESIHASAHALARNVDTRGEQGSVLFAFNPLPWRRKAVVQFDTFRVIHGRDEITHLQTQAGKRIPLQWLTADANFGPWGLPWGKMTAVVELPPCGYQVLRVCTRRLANPAPDVAAVESGAVQLVKQRGADVLRRRVFKRPAFRSLKTESGRELLKAHPRFIVISDPPGTWGGGIDRYDRELGKPGFLGTELLEDGQLLKLFRQKYRWKSSELWLDVLFYSHTSLVGLRAKVNWQEQRELVKLEFPTRLIRTLSIAKVPGTAVSRNAEGNEEPCLDWVASEGLVGRDPASLILINNGSHSYSNENGSLRTIIARGVPFAEHPPFEYSSDNNVAFTDRGWQERCFWVMASDSAVNELPLARMLHRCD